MGFLELIGFQKKDTAVTQRVEKTTFERNVQAGVITTTSTGHHVSSNPYTYDGEKNPNEMGTPVDWDVDYYSMRARAWESYLSSDLAQNTVKKFQLWNIGPGLKIQAEPNTNILSRKNIEVPKDFVENVENSFRQWVKSKHSSYSNMQNVNELGSEAYKNAFLSGDILVVMRVINGMPKVEIIDGGRICQPTMADTNYFEAAEKRNNTITDGIERTSSGEHYAFYVKNKSGFTKILAKGARSGRVQAWMAYGMRYKIDSVRGLSSLSTLLEEGEKLDRYKEATIGAAEENSKYAFFIEHGNNSTGANPLLKGLQQSANAGQPIAKETNFGGNEQAATKISASTGKQAINLENDSTVKKSTDNVDINFESFYSPNSDIYYATAGIAPEVAKDKFGGAYSGSRAALKSWEYKILTDRVTFFETYFYKPIYAYWLDIMILKGDIIAGGYFEAMQSKDTTALEAYRSSRFIGATVPHIDPLKEVNAERKALGPAYDNVPLKTAEQACENLNTGDYTQIQKKAENEIEQTTFKPNVVDNGNGGNGAS